jgi:hypothetical protein
MQVQGDRKVTQLIPDTLYLQKKIEKTKKNNVILSWECPPRSAMHVFSLLPVFDRRDTVSLAQENRKMYP